MLQAKNGNNWPSGHQEEVKMWHCKRTTDEDGRRSIATIDSGDSKRKKASLPWNYTNISR